MTGLTPAAPPAAEPAYPLLHLSRHRLGTDGVGVTTLVAGAGCPLYCRWCLNARLLREAPAEYVSAQTLLERVRVDDLYFRATGGGITFGGGEALLHADFIRSFRGLCPPEWRIAVETSLAVPEGALRTVLGSVDEYLVDCKDLNPARYAAYTGGDAALMLANLRLLLEAVDPSRVLVRVPLIPGYNTPEDQAASAALLRGMGAERLDLFSYIIPDS